MDSPDLSRALEEVGLPAKAASIYLSLLGSRRMAISDISRETKIKRATCYEYLDLLLSKEFVIRIPVGKRMFYAAVEPRKVLNDFKNKTALFEEKVNEMAKIREAAVQKPRVVFYEGKREIKNIYGDLLRTVGDVHSIFPSASFFENFTEEDYDEFDKAMTSHALKSRDLFVADKSYPRIKEMRERNGGDKAGKKLPPWFTCNVDMLIYSEKIALISLRDLSAIVIENKDIADLFRNMHSFMWKSL